MTKIHPLKIQGWKGQLTQFPELIAMKEAELEQLKAAEAKLKAQIEEAERNNEVEEEAPVEEEVVVEEEAPEEAVEEETPSDLTDEAIEEIEEAIETLEVPDEEVQDVALSELSRDELKAVATEAGVEFKPNIPTKKLIELLEGQ
jgi:SMC interacting uncharacterized protein involved in chromosome segregation